MLRRMFGSNHVITYTEADKYPRATGPMILVETVNGRFTGRVCRERHQQTQLRTWLGEHCHHPDNWWQMAESVYQKWEK